MREEDDTIGEMSRETPFRLEEWEVLPARNLIRRDGEPVILQPKIMRLLAVLAAAPGATLSREELIERVWYGINVSDAAIDRAVCSLRKALGDNATQPRFVERIRKRGVRLMVDPVEPEPEPGMARKPSELAFGRMASVVSLASRRRLAAPFLVLIAGLLALGFTATDRAEEALTATVSPTLGAPASVLQLVEPATVSLTPMRYSSTECEADLLFKEDPVTDI